MVSDLEKAPEIRAGAPWLTLKSGDKVSVETSEGSSVTGVVDVVADDHSVLWIHLGGHGRRLVHWQEAATVTRRVR